MSYTRGGPNKRRQFQWHYDPETRQLLIIAESGREFMYSLEEIQRVLVALHQRFSSIYFPLSNSIALLDGGAAKAGLGITMFECFPVDVHRSQGASYLGVVLEEAGYFAWNSKTVGICWRLVNFDFTLSTLSANLHIDHLELPHGLP
jgi:hypothetical protein